MTEATETWAVLRGLRGSPPGRAAQDPVRRSVFAAGLEQAEQFLAAAAAVGFATKPVQLFYALSQAGRAIAAARANEPWQIHGHGAAVSERPEIGTTRIKPDTRASGAIGLVATATGSEMWEGSVELGALWASLPELHPEPALCGGAPVALRVEPDMLYAQPIPYGGGEWFPVTTPIRHGLITRAGIDMGRTFADEESLREAVAELLSHYPRATGWTLTSTPTMTFTTHPEGAATVTTSMMRSGPTTVWLTWAHDEGGQRVVTAVEALAVEFGGELYFRPGIGKQAELPSPLITWWAVLLGLSSLARYEPVAWRKALEIDSSPTAWALERGLTFAQQRIPELVLEALAQPSSP